MKSFKFFIVFSLILASLVVTSCGSSAGASHQIQAENNGLNNAILMTAYKAYYKKEYSKGFDLLSNYVFNQNGKSLLIHALLIKIAHKSNRVEALLTRYQKLVHNKYYIFAKSLLMILEERRKKDNLRYIRNKVLYFFPENPVVQMYLGYLYVLNNRPHLAIKVLEKSLSSLKNFAFSNYYMALAYYHIRDKGEASGYINKAIKLFPSFMKEEIIASRSFLKKILSM